MRRTRRIPLAGAHSASSRVGWLDGLRGVAALQVVFLHYACAFLPGAGLNRPALMHFRWEQAFMWTPLSFLLDGSSAVYLFFIMSGVVLTYAFSAGPLDIKTAILRRLARLGMPMVASTLFAGALFMLLPNAHRIAASFTRASWLSSVGPEIPTFSGVIHQLFLEGMLAGFANTTIIPAFAADLLSLAQSSKAYNSPLWSLHFELVGSLLVLLLVAIRAHATPLMYRVSCLVLTGCFLNSLLALFILGHAIAGWLRKPAAQRSSVVVGLSCLAAGIAICVADKLDIISFIGPFLPNPPLGPWNGTDVIQKTVGAVLVFLGIACLPGAQRILQTPVFRWVGKISFSLYLVHFPIMVTCAAALLTWCGRFMSYGASIALASTVGIAISLVAAVLFERCIDQAAIGFSRQIGRRPGTWIPRAAVPAAAYRDSATGRISRSAANVFPFVSGLKNRVTTKLTNPPTVPTSIGSANPIPRSTAK